MIIDRLLSPDHRIDGAAFVELDEQLVREMVPPIGLVKKVMALIPKVSMYSFAHKMLAYIWIMPGCRNTQYLW